MISCTAPLVATDRNRYGADPWPCRSPSFVTPDAPSRARIVPLPIQLLANRLARREQNYWINDLGWIERLVLTLNDAADCRKMVASLACRVESFGRPVVLAVEDEPLILMLAVDIIRDAGFEPLWASNADEAIRILEGRDV